MPAIVSPGSGGLAERARCEQPELVDGCQTVTDLIQYHPNASGEASCGENMRLTRSWVWRSDP